MTTLLGKLHPLVVHFPIALLIAALLFAWLGRRGGDVRHAVRPLLALAAASAALAALTGWMFAEQGAFFGRAGHHLLWHRWLGVGAAVSAVALFALLRRRTPTSAGALAGLALAAALVGVTGHFGGLLVFGDDHWVLVEVPPKRVSKLTDPVGVKRVGREEDAVVEPAELPEQVTFAHVRPLLRRSCLRCHDARKRKGDLRLDDKRFAMEGGESGVVIVPGDAEASRLFQLISLPQDHEDYMPSKGDPLTAAEVALIGKWIDQGADWPDDG